MDHQTSNDILQAGTGFMESLSDGIHRLQAKGYVENLTPKFDHFECRSGEIKLYPKDFTIDKVIRFENTSDPDDQSIIYAIASKEGDIRGVYVDSYGLYHDELSADMIQHFKDCPH